MSAAVPASPWAAGWKTFLSWYPVDEFFSLDLRSLAVFRIGLGVMLLQEWLNRLVDLRMHYTDDGVVPRSVIGQNGPISLFMLSGSAWWAGTLMGVGCVLALLLLAGWRTQFVTFLSWILLIGAHGRNAAIMQGGDQVMRMLLFWGLFLPLGACYSIDAFRAGPREWRPRVLSVGTVAYVAQICLLYWFAAAWKTAPEWRKDFTAIYLALSLDGFATSFGHWLLNFPDLLKALTVGTMILEIFGPALLFLPIANAQMRLVAILGFISFHMGLVLTMELGNFPWICMVAWLALLPAWFWDRLEARLGSPKRAGLAVYYDGDNPAHRRFVEAVRSFLLLYESKAVPVEQDGAPAPLSGDRRGAITAATPKEKETGRLSARVRSAGPWLVVDHAGKEHAGYDGLLALVWASFLYRPLAGVLRWGPVRRRGERLLARVAARPLPKLAAPAAPAPPYPGSQLGGLIQNTIVVSVLAYLIAWNVRTLDASERQTHFGDYFPQQVNSLAVTLGLDQSWGLFAPSPGRWDGWYVIPAVLEDGRVVDLYRDGAELTDAKPPLVSATYTNTRTRKHLMNLVAPMFAQLRPYYARYLYEEWNRTHPDDQKINHLFIIYMFKETEPDRQVTEVREMRLQHWPPEPDLVDPIARKQYRVGPLSAALGPTGEVAALHLYNRPILPELMKEGK
jgi:hypothetical protein